MGKTGIFVCAAFAATLFAPSGAWAQAPQNPAYMSCGELWHARNAIYARNGYCFKSARAIEAFGEGCFPPYGQLRGWDKDRVDALQMREARKGC